MHQELRRFEFKNLRHCAKEICNSMRTGQVTDEQGKEALFRLLLAACGAKQKGG